MNIVTREQAGWAVARLEGEVDLSHSPALRKLLMDWTLDRRDIMIDLAEVSYIDSSGLAALVEAYQGARDSGAFFVLVAASRPVLRVLTLARLDRVFRLADSVEAALALPHR